MIIKGKHFIYAFQALLIQYAQFTLDVVQFVYTTYFI